MVMDLHAILEDLNPWWRDPGRRRASAYPERRDLQPTVVERLGDLESRRATIVRGPRQVGKTVLLLQVADELLDKGWVPANLTYFDFSDDRLTEEVTARQVAEISPPGFEDESPRVFLFDEVSKAPRWDRWLKQAVDRREGRIVVTDSSASLLRGGAVESGQGRWDELSLDGLSFREYLRFNRPGERGEATIARAPQLLQRYLDVGGFPGFAHHSDPQEVWRLLRSDIAERAILRDLARHVNKLDAVRDLFVYLVQDSGARFNSAARASDLGADDRSVRNWLRLLVETCLLVPLPLLPMSTKASSRLRAQSSPKVYAVDHGLVAAFSVWPDRMDQEARGRLYETVVFAHLRVLARKLGSELHYFRERDRHEVDFIVQSERGKTAIEVTASPRIRPERLRRLMDAKDRAGADRTLLVYGGLVQADEGTGRVPLARFLMDPAEALEGAIG